MDEETASTKAVNLLARAVLEEGGALRPGDAASSVLPIPNRVLEEAITTASAEPAGQDSGGDHCDVPPLDPGDASDSSDVLDNPGGDGGGETDDPSDNSDSDFFGS